MWGLPAAFGTGGIDFLSGSVCGDSCDGGVAGGASAGGFSGGGLGRFLVRGDLLELRFFEDFEGGPRPPRVVSAGRGGSFAAEEDLLLCFFRCRSSSDVLSEVEELLLREAEGERSQASITVPVWSQRLCSPSQDRHRLLSSILTTMSHLCLNLQLLALQPSLP